MKKFDFRKYGSLIALLGLFLIGAIWQHEFFLSPENLRNLLNQNAYIGVIAIGMTVVISVGGIDLSVGSLMALAAAAGVTVTNRMIAGGGSESIAVLVGATTSLISATALGLFNGSLVAYGRIAPFIATLGGLVGYRSLTLVIADGGEIRSQSNQVLAAFASQGLPWPSLSGGRPVITWPTAIFILLGIASAFLMSRTQFGLHATAVGSNQRAARYSAISPAKVKLLAYMFLGACCGIAAWMQASRMNSVSSSGLGQLNELDAIAAVVIGGTSLRGGRSYVWGTVCGVLILGILNTLLVSSGVSNYWQGFVRGAVIVLAVLLQRSKDD